MNWASAAWGVTLVVVEFGYILLYRAGWKISMASLMINITVALLLAGLGVLFLQGNLAAQTSCGHYLGPVGNLFSAHLNLFVVVSRVA